MTNNGKAEKIGRIIYTTGCGVSETTIRKRKGVFVFMQNIL